MKCKSAFKTDRHNEDSEYEFTPLNYRSLVYDNYGHDTAEIADAVNALVKENERLKEEFNSLEALVLNQQSIINHLISRIEALEKAPINRCYYDS